jgi:ribosome-binding protein aMBF1 (putative translation factor)
MSDSELIIRLLKAAEKRVRGNRVLQQVASGLALALLLPVVFKIVDFFVGFRLATVAIFFVVWGAATAIWLFWRTRGLGESLQGIAASLDNRASGHDQLKTAYWFIRNPKDSEWVHVQIRRAAASAQSIAVNTLYPRQLPRASYLAIGLVLLLGLLNFAPLPWNNNWLRGEGAPAFALDDADKAALEHALELLKKAEELNQTDLAERLAQIIKALQEGGMSKDQLSKSLSELQQALAERNLDAGRMTDGLERIAKALDPSQFTKPVATEIFKLDLNAAANEVREIEKNLGASNESKLKELAERIQEASDVAGQGLEQLSQHLRDTADAMRRRDTNTGQRGLQQVARELERLQRVLESQRLQSEAASELASVSDSVGGTPGEIGSGDETPGQGEGEGEGQGEGEGGEGTGGQGQGTGEGEGQGEGEGEGQGEGEGGQQPGEGGGSGGKQSGTSGPFPMRGDPTSLETQFEKEPLPIRPTRGSRPETIEEASQRERSRLDYRNVKSNLTPAQRDTLNQDPIPFEQRQFVKEYIESLRP